jgi:ubiquinone/menaquinone biosynthesis C-methylase UbiE
MPSSTSETEPIRREYARLAPDYDRRWAHYLRATLDLALEPLDDDNLDLHQVLDVPCGTGELVRRLLARRPNLQIVGVDVTGEMLCQAASKDVTSTVTWLQADVCQLPLADHTFDVAVCANSFHYFRSPEASLREFRRVLRPGGQLVLVDWCDDYLTCKLCSLWLRWTDPAFFKTYSLHSCRSLMEAAGFRIESTDRARVGILWGLMRLVGRA